MPYSPREHIEYAKLKSYAKDAVDAYVALTRDDKAIFRNYLYLCDESIEEMGNGFAEMSLPEDFISGIPAYLGTEEQAELLIDNLSDNDRLILSEYVYNNLIAVSKTIFFNDLSNADKTIAFTKLCEKLRTKANFFNLTFKS